MKNCNPTPTTRKFRTQFQENFPHTPGETNNLPNLTVPDQSMTIQEILARYARGLSIPTQQPMFFAGDMPYAELSNMSDIEKYDFYQKTVQAYEIKQAELAELREKRLKSVREQREKERTELQNMRDFIANYDKNNGTLNQSNT